MKAWALKALATARHLAILAGRHIRVGFVVAARNIERVRRSPRTHRILLFTKRSTLRMLSVLFSATRVGLCGAGVAFLVLLGLASLTRRVPPGQIGVRQAPWGSGVEDRDRPSGMHFAVRGLHTWHMLERGTHLASFGTGTEGAAPALDLRTREGNEVRVRAAVPYRIRPGEAHLLVGAGLKSTYPSLVRATVADVVLQGLAELSADDLVDTDARLAQLERTLAELRTALAPMHVEPLGLQVHQVAFGKRYEVLLQQKQLSRQLALLAEAGRKVEEEMMLNMEEKEGEAAVARIEGDVDKQIEELRSARRLELSTILSDTATYDADRRAEANAEHGRLIAEADLELYRATSLEERLTHAAYDTPGGRLDLARQAAGKLRIERVTLNSNDPNVPSVLDLDQLVELLRGARD